MKLSLVTGTRNRPESLERLIESINRYTYASSYELIIADASDCPSRPRTEPWIHTIIEQPRLGFAKGINRAFSFAQGDWIIWLNDDCEVLKFYDTSAIEFMERHPEIGLGALHYLEGRRGFHVNSYFGMVYANFGIISRELFDTVGGFDEEFALYGTDNALAFRVLLAEKGIAPIPGKAIIHHALDDDERKSNDDYQSRLRDVEKLTRKYAPYLPKMSLTYAANGGIFIGQDQTPDWVNQIANQ